MTELALRSDTVTRDWVELMAPAVELAKQVAGTTFVPQGLRNDPAAIVAAILYGDEVGLGPMQALAKIAVINGRPSLASEAQRAMILAAGHELWIVEATVTRVTVAGRRKGSDQTSTVTWSMDDAKRAGLAGGQNYRRYPRQMLLARAFAELARMLFADAIGGLAATEEIEEGEVNFEDEAPVEKTSTTKRRRTRATNTTAGVTSAGAAELPAAPEPEAPPLPGEEEADRLQSEANAAKAGEERKANAETAEEPTSTFEDMHTEAQYRKLNVLVGQLRDAGHVTTEHLWFAVASRRNVELESMIELLSGRDELGVLHWAPLRDSLSKAEASDLIERLSRLEENVARRNESFE